MEGEQLTKREGAIGKIIKIKVLNISDSFLFYFVANMYGYIFQIGYTEIQPLSNYLVAGLKYLLYYNSFFINKMIPQSHLCDNY